MRFMSLKAVMSKQVGGAVADKSEPVLETGLTRWQSARAQDSTETHVFGAILMMCSDVQRHV